MGTIEKAGRRRAGSGREKHPAYRPFAFSIVLIDREPGTGYIFFCEGVVKKWTTFWSWSQLVC